MAGKLTELTQNTRIFDPGTGQPTREFLQWANALVRELRKLQAGS